MVTIEFTLVSAVCARAHLCLTHSLNAVFSRGLQFTIQGRLSVWRQRLCCVCESRDVTQTLVPPFTT